jgi:hypothetical protein
MAGTPAYWRTSSNDADRNPEFLDVWLNEFDAISPWTIGRYGNEEEADRFAEKNMKGDVELLKKRNEEGSSRKVDYIPVVLPGGSVSFPFFVHRRPQSDLGNVVLGVQFVRGEVGV